jgi:LuxR family transcriptional regulator, maltose regulon positive regulatory protein
MRTTAGGPVPSWGREDNRLLDDKVRVPRAGIQVLHRSRVSRLIDEAVSHRITLLTGPAGAGKTVACAGWAASKPAGEQPAWLTLDAADADPARFFHYVTAALSGAGTLTADQARNLSALPPAEIPAGIAAATRARTAPAVLVLDDIQELASRPAPTGLEYLIRQAPQGLRLLLSGRCAPGVALARLRVAGELADIGASDLICTPDEVDAYFAMQGRPVTPVEREQALGWTEGWMAGLRLMALGASGDEAREQAIVADYLWDEVLAPMPERARTLLLRTCLTPKIAVELAEALTGEPAAGRMLDQLSKTNGLVQAVHPESEYRYHPMLRAVLNSALRRELPDEVPDLLRQVARWHADHGDVLRAEEAAADTGDWDYGLDVLHEAGPAAVVSADGPELEAVLGSFPADRRTNDTVLAVALAAARLWQGDADGALPHLETAEAALTRLSGPERGATRLWLTALRVMWQASLSAAERGSPAPYWSLAEAAHEDASTTAEHNALGMLWLALGTAALRDLDAPRARAALLHASSQLSAGGSRSLRERARAWDAVASAWYGDLAAAGRLAASVIDGPHGHDRDLAPILALAAAIGHLTRDEPDAAAAMLDEAELEAGSDQPAGEPPIAVLAGLLRARLAVAQGNLAGARGLVRWLTEATVGRDAVGQLIAVLDAEISLAAGERERARAALAGVFGQQGRTGVPARPGLAAGVGVPVGMGMLSRPGVLGGAGERARVAKAAAPPRHGQDLLPVRPEAAICRARLMIADDDDKGALALVEPLLADGGGGVTLADRLAALLTAAVAHRRVGQAGEAAEQLEEALALAEPDEACGAFVAAGAPIRSALTVLMSPGGRYTAFAARILERFESRVSNSPGAPSGTPLTESELAVLRFLPSHMTNQEIAESLFLSINTIKTHLSSVYRKLGVVNRRQAIAQGRRLDLLLGS